MESTKLKDAEIITCIDKKSSDDFFQIQAETDRWVRVFTNEMETAPLENCPLSLFTDKEGYETKKGFRLNFEADTENEDILSSMTNTKLSLCFPENGKIVMYPLRYTAFNHIQERAGISGGSINSLRNRKRAQEMAPEVRSKILNEGLELYTDKSLVLIRDGKATAVLSGDEADYAITPMPEIIKILDEELQYFGNTSFLRSVISHEINVIEYSIDDTAMKQQIRDSIMLTFDNKVSVKLSLASSDVGKCSITLSPVIEIDGVDVPIGQTLSVTHKGTKVKDVFRENCKKFLSSYRLNLDMIKKLNTVCINNPASCFKNVYEALKITGYAASFKEILARIEDEHVSSCTAFDIYFYFCEMLANEKSAREQKGEQIGLYEFAKAKDTVSTVLFLNLVNYDY